jgi:hypothetical protein
MLRSLEAGTCPLKTGNQIFFVEAWVRLNDFVDRQAVLKVFKQHLNRNARPPEDRAAAQYLGVSNNHACHICLSDSNQLLAIT